jgi:hypothetical protein
MDSLSLGRSSFPTAMTYPRSLLLSCVNIQADPRVPERGVEELDQGYPHPVLVCRIL